MSFCPEKCEKLQQVKEILAVTKSGEELFKQFRYCPFHEYLIKKEGD